MYWKRAAYFWAFIVAVYTAFFHVLTLSDEVVANKWIKSVFLIIIALLGFCFCLGFWLQNIGSKQWQENWETHVELLEDTVVGPLYKVFVQKPGDNFSVTRINAVLCKCLIGASILVLGYSVFLLCSKFNNIYVKIVIPIAVIIFGLIIVLIAHKGKLHCLKGNELEDAKKKIDEHDVPFGEKVFEEKLQYDPMSKLPNIKI